MAMSPRRRSSIPRTLKLDEGRSHRDEIIRNLRAPLKPCLVVIVGPDLGLSARVDGSFLVGRDPEAAMCLSDPLVSFHHFRIEDRGDAFAAVDEGSTNGMQINGEGASEHLLRPNDKIQVGSTVLRFEVRDESDQAYDEAVQRLIHIDDLTGLYLRRRFDQELAQLVRTAKAEHSRVGLLVMDLDGLKAINDEHGHLFGAYVIGETGRVIGACLPSRGIAARFGGDEYLAAAPGLGVAECIALGESVRAAIADHAFEKEGIRLHPGISIGAAAYPESAGDPETLFRRADEALYQAKADGKNRVRASVPGG